MDAHYLKFLAPLSSAHVVCRARNVEYWVFGPSGSSTDELRPILSGKPKGHGSYIRTLVRRTIQSLDITSCPPTLDMALLTIILTVAEMMMAGFGCRDLPSKMNSWHTETGCAMQGPRGPWF